MTVRIHFVTIETLINTHRQKFGTESSVIISLLISYLVRFASFKHWSTTTHQSTDPAVKCPEKEIVNNSDAMRPQS